MSQRGSNSGDVDGRRQGADTGNAQMYPNDSGDRHKEAFERVQGEVRALETVVGDKLEEILTSIQGMAEEQRGILMRIYEVELRTLAPDRLETGRIGREGGRGNKRGGRGGRGRGDVGYARQEFRRVNVDTLHREEGGEGLERSESEVGGGLSPCHSTSAVGTGTNAEPLLAPQGGAPAQG